MAGRDRESGADTRSAVRWVKGKGVDRWYLDDGDGIMVYVDNTDKGGGFIVKLWGNSHYSTHSRHEALESAKVEAERLFLINAL